MTCKVISYNAAIGANVIQLPDGSITYAQSDTNGAIALGETVPLHGGTGNIDGLPNIKRAVAPTVKTVMKAPKDNIKILFFKETISNGIYRTEYYIGGDRLLPTLVATVDVNDPLEFTATRYAYLHNTGVSQTDWIVAVDYHNTNYDGLKFGEGLYTFRGNTSPFRLTYEQTFSLENDTYVGFALYPGYGVWQATQDLPGINNFDYYSIYLDTIKRAEVRANSGQLYFLPDERFLRTYDSSSYSEPLITNSTRDKIIISTRKRRVLTYSLLTPSNQYTINNFDNLLFITGITWIGDYIYAVPALDELKTIKSGKVELEVYKFKIQIETNNTVTLIKTMSKFKVNALSNVPDFTIIWAASYFPGK